MKITMLRDLKQLLTLKTSVPKCDQKREIRDRLHQLNQLKMDMLCARKGSSTIGRGGFENTHEYILKGNNSNLFLNPHKKIRNTTHNERKFLQFFAPSSVCAAR